MGRLIDTTVLFEAIEKSNENNNHTDAVARRTHNEEHNHFLYMICQQPTVKRPSDIESDWEDFSVGIEMLLLKRLILSERS